MNTLINVVRREVVERRNVLAAAFVAGFIPYFVQLLRSNSSSSNSGVEARNVVMVMLVAGLLPSLALIMGATMIGRDLSERRLSFYLTRPISAPALWIGKVVASLAILVIAGLLLSLPVLLVNRITIPDAWSFDESSAMFYFVEGVILLLLLSHAISTAVRSRSRWIVLDFAAGLLVIALVWLAIQRLLPTGAYSIVRNLADGLIVVLVASLMIAGARQLSLGRSDRVYSHRALSLTLWPLLLAAALLLSAYSLWFVRVDLADLRQVRRFSTASDSDWISVTGTAKGRGAEFMPTFGYNVRDHRELRCPGVCNEFLLSENGRTAIAMSTEFRSFFETDVARTLYVANLSEKHPRLRATDLSMKSYGSVAISPDGTRVAFADARLVAVYDLATRRLISSIPLGQESGYADVSFITTDRLLIDQHGQYEHRSLLTLDLPNKGRRPVLLAELKTDPSGLVLLRGDRRLGRLLVLQSGRAEGREARLTRISEYDLAKGALTFSRDLETRGNVFPLHLHDGSIVYTELPAIGPPQLVTVKRDGSEHRVSLEGLNVEHAAVEREEAGGMVLLTSLLPVSGTDSAGMSGSGWQISVVDPLSGKTSGPILRELKPLDRVQMFWGGDPLERSRRLDRNHLFVDRTGALVQADLAQGKTHRILDGE